MRSASAWASVSLWPRRAAMSFSRLARRRSTSAALASACSRWRRDSSMSWRMPAERAAKNGPAFLPMKYPNRPARTRKLAHLSASSCLSPKLSSFFGPPSCSCARAGRPVKARPSATTIITGTIARRLMRRSAGGWSPQSGWRGIRYPPPGWPWRLPRRPPVASWPG